MIFQLKQFDELEMFIQFKTLVTIYRNQNLGGLHVKLGLETKKILARYIIQNNFFSSSSQVAIIIFAFKGFVQFTNMSSCCNFYKLCMLPTLLFSYHACKFVFSFDFLSKFLGVSVLGLVCSNFDKLSTNFTVFFSFFGLVSDCGSEDTSVERVIESHGHAKNIDEPNLLLLLSIK